MPNEAYLSTWKTYQSAWSDVGDAERKRLLQASVSENCIYAAEHVNDFDTAGFGI